MNQNQKRKARLRLARRVALVTVCLLIGVCVYSVLGLVPVSTADGFFGRAKVWLSNILQQDAAVNVRMTDTDDYSRDTSSERSGYKTVEEIRAAVGVPVYEPTQMDYGVKLGNVEVAVADGDFISCTYRYVADGDSVVLFTIRPRDGAAQLDSMHDAIMHAAPVGEFSLVKASSDGWRAVANIGEVMVSIHGKMDFDAFLNLLDTLRVVN